MANRPGEKGVSVGALNGRYNRVQGTEKKRKERACLTNQKFGFREEYLCS